MDSAHQAPARQPPSVLGGQLPWRHCWRAHQPAIHSPPNGLGLKLHGRPRSRPHPCLPWPSTAAAFASFQPALIRGLQGGGPRLSKTPNNGGLPACRMGARRLPLSWPCSTSSTGRTLYSMTPVFPTACPSFEWLPHSHRGRDGARDGCHPPTVSRGRHAKWRSQRPRRRTRCGGVEVCVCPLSLSHTHAHTHPEMHTCRASRSTATPPRAQKYPRRT